MGNTGGYAASGFRAGGYVRSGLPGTSTLAQHSPIATAGWIRFMGKGMDSFIRRAEKFEQKEKKVSEVTLKAIAKAIAEEARLEAPFWTGLLSSSHASTYEPGALDSGSYGPKGIVYLEPHMHRIIPELTTVYGPRYHLHYPWFLITLRGAGRYIVEEEGAKFAEPYEELFDGSSLEGPISVFA